MNAMDALHQIADKIAPYVSTKFVEGDPLADDVETILDQAGIKFEDTPDGVKRKI